MASTGIVELKVHGLHGRSLVQSNTQPAGEGATVNVTNNFAAHAAVTHQLSRIEQIVEYLKVLYR